MPRAHPRAFPRAVELARERAKPVSEIARDLGISDSCLRGSVAEADIEGPLRGADQRRRPELIELRRKLRNPVSGRRPVSAPRRSGGAGGREELAGQASRRTR